MSTVKNVLSIRITFAVIIFMALTLTSCDGGGGNNVTLGGVNIPTQAVTLTSENIQQVSASSNQANDQTNTASSVVDRSNSVNANSSAGAVQKSAVLIKSLAIKGRSGNGTISALAVTICPGGGSFTNPDTTTGIGDYVYDNCKFSDSFMVNGSISITGTGDLIGGSSFNGSYIYKELTVTSNATTSVFDGRMNINWSDNGVVSDGTIDIPSLTYVFGQEGVKISGYSLTFSEDTSQGTGWVDYQYTISSTVLGGSVNVETTQRFDYYLGIEYEYPFAGQIIVSGANNSKGRLTVEAGGTGVATDYVLIELDADGDGIYEDSRRVQWLDLQ